MNTVKIDQFRTRAEIQPVTMDEEKRTVEVVFATSTPVRRYDYSSGQPFDEVLDFAPGSMRMERMLSAPVLDDHNRWSGVRGQLGIVENARIENGRGIAILRMSNREDVTPIWEDIKAGIIRNLSVGYKVHKYMRDAANIGEVPVYRAVDWEPMEVSFVTVPADPASVVQGVRSSDASAYEVQLVSVSPNPQKAMPEDLTPQPAPDNQRSEGTIPTPAPVIDQDAVRTEAVRAERKRVAEIHEAVRAAKLSSEFAEKLITDGVDVNAARAAIIAEFAKGDATPSLRSTNATVNADRDAEGKRNAMVDGLLLRSGGNVSDEVAKDRERMRAAHEYRSNSLLDVARMSLEQRGVNTRGMSRVEIAGRALSSTSDFPVLLENVMHKVLLTAYQTVPDEWRGFCATGSVSDFRPHHRYRTGALGNLSVINENGEYTHLALVDGEKESIAARTYGKIITISREMIVNDDLNAFNRLAADLGRSAARTINAAVFAALGENAGLGPVMNDGLTLFHADHGNIGTGAAISVDSLDADRTLMRLQKEPGGQDYIEVRPAVLLVPVGLESKANVYNQAQFDVDVTSKFQVPNKVLGMFRNVIGTPRLSGTRRYMFADPNVEPVLEVAFLDGQQSPYMEMEESFKTDGVSWKVRHDFGVGAIGYRGALTNAGV